MASQQDIILSLWEGLQGTWRLSRKLQSMDAHEPSGACEGTATFTPRAPAVFIDDDGQLQNASKEMLYSEAGEFEMSQTTSAVPAPRFTFSRKYIWRLQSGGDVKPEISIWFTKPGTTELDYLFHRFAIQHVISRQVDGITSSTVECTGGHLCVEDFYSSTYMFNLQPSEDNRQLEASILGSWSMHHEVQGPKKDQVIETIFSKQ